MLNCVTERNKARSIWLYLRYIFSNEALWCLLKISTVLPWLTRFSLRGCGFSVGNMKGDLHTWEYNTLIWWRLWRRNGCEPCIFSSALRWEKSAYREISRKSARESKGDQTFQMILINYLVYSNPCCPKRAKLRYYCICSPVLQCFPLWYPRFSMVS